MAFNEYQVALWKTKADVQEVIDFYQGEIDHKAYADGRGGYGSQWPDERMDEFISSRQKIILELHKIMSEK